MTPRTRLKSLESTLLKRLRHIRKVLASLSRLPTGATREAPLSYVVITLQSTWASFVRAYFLSCFLQPKTTGGRRIVANAAFPSSSDAIRAAIKAVRPQMQLRANGRLRPRNDPVWHDPSTLCRLASQFGFSNGPDICAAFGLGATVFRNLPVFRNYYGHKSQSSCDAAMRLASTYSIPAFGRPSDILTHCPKGRPQWLIREWIDEVEITAELLCSCDRRP